MTIYTFPAITPSKATWGMKSNTEKFSSPMNGTVQTVSRPGSRWRASLEFSGMTLAQGATFDAFLASLDGMAGRFYLPPHHRLGTGAACTVNGASQTGRILTITAAAGRAFAAGDYFSVNGEFKMVTVAATADGAGAINLQFSPALRAAPPNGATVTFAQPVTLMMLDSDEYSVVRVPGPLYETIVIACSEVFV